MVHCINGPVRSLRNAIAKAEDMAKLKESNANRGLRSKIKRDKLTIEQKMQIPEYAAAVAFNKKHGLDPRKFKSQKKIGGPGKGKYWGKSRKVSLPVINMPMAPQED